MRTRERMRFGVGLHLNEESMIITEYVRLAESLNFEYAWISDICSYRNAWVTLGAIATQTKRIKMGTAVANLYIRHPIVTASAVATLDEISNGRAVLGVGSGSKFMEPLLGIKMEKPFTACKEAVEIIRRLLKGETVHYSGEAFELEGARLAFRREKIPIYIGARGPKMLELSGEIADGVIMHGVSTKYLRLAIQHVMNGANVTGRSLAEIDLAVMTPLIITNDPTSAKEVLKPEIASQAIGVSSKTSDWYDLNQQDMKNIEALRKAYSRPLSEEASRLVTDEMINAFSIVGSREECLTKVDELFKLGVTHIIMDPFPPIKQNIKYLSEIIKNYME